MLDAMTPAASPAPLDVAAPDDAEEGARAELYGLLAQLWLQPPDAALRAQFAIAVTQAPEPGAHLERPWQDLVGVLRELDEAQLRAEFEALFQGVGRPEILPFGSFHLSGALNDRPLASLRADLAALGLGRDEARLETEDHVGYVLEVMRYLIAGGDAAVCTLAQQQRFFRAHVQSWLPRLCEAVRAHPRAHAYAALAALTQAFVEIEAQAFDLLET